MSILVADSSIKALCGLQHWITVGLCNTSFKSRHTNKSLTALNFVLKNRLVNYSIAGSYFTTLLVYFTPSAFRTAVLLPNWIIFVIRHFEVFPHTNRGLVLKPAYIWHSQTQFRFSRCLLNGFIVKRIRSATTCLNFCQRWS